MYFSSILEMFCEVTSFVYTVSEITTSRSHVFLSRTYICINRDWSVLDKRSVVIQNNNISFVRKINGLYIYADMVSTSLKACIYTIYIYIHTHMWISQ